MSSASSITRPTLLDIILRLIDIFDITENQHDIITDIENVLKQCTDRATREVACDVARVGTVISFTLDILDRTPYESLRTILAMISVARHYLETHYAKKLRRHGQQLEEIVQKLREVEDKLIRVAIEVYKAEH